MSQNDFNLANQGFPSMRSDLNDALQALASNSSGGTAPTVTYANQWWYDSSANILYFRNEDNDGWIEFVKFDQANDTWNLKDVLVKSGTATITMEDAGGTDNATAKIRSTIDGSLVLSADPDDLSATTAMRFDVDGSEAMRINNSGWLGIAKTDPQYKLDVDGTGRFLKSNNASNLILETIDTDSDAGPVLELFRNPSQAGVDNDSLGEIHFTGLNDASEISRFAEIVSRIVDASDGTEDGRLGINVKKDGVDVSVLNANMSNGEVVINDNSNDIDFRVESDGKTHAFFVDAANDQVKIGNVVGAGGDEGNAALSVVGTSTTRVADFDRPTTTANNHVCNFYSNVGGTNTINAVIEASGDLENTNNRYTGLSDERLKQDIVDASSQWDDIKALQVRKYRFINHVEQMGDDASVQLGVIAQELEASGMNGLVKTKPIDENDPDGPDRKSVAYSVLYMKAVKALQEAMERIEALETRVAALES